MTYPHPYKETYLKGRLLGIALATALSAIACHSYAQVAVPGSVNFDIGTGNYTYAYSVVNTGPAFDLAIINVPVLPGSALMNLVSPSGFQISFDPGVGIVSFLEDADPGTLPTFAPAATIGLFTFTSAVGPGTVTFDALDADGNSFTGTTLSPAVPEPGTAALLCMASLLPALFSRRRRSVSDDSHTHPTHN